MKMKRNTKGFTLVEIMIVVAIIGILVGIAVPGFIKAREKAQANACMEGQTKMEGAVDNYAIDNGLKTGDATITSALIVGPTLYLKTAPTCPVGPVLIAIPPVGNVAICPNPDLAVLGKHLRP
jgi:prepilin-type N-terminal cleavage/methylation domain-containing protein